MCAQYSLHENYQLIGQGKYYTAPVHNYTMWELWYQNHIAGFIWWFRSNLLSLIAIKTIFPLFTKYSTAKLPIYNQLCSKIQIVNQLSSNYTFGLMKNTVLRCFWYDRINSNHKLIFSVCCITSSILNQRHNKLQ